MINVASRTEPYHNINKPIKVQKTKAILYDAGRIMVVVENVDSGGMRHVCLLRPTLRASLGSTDPLP